MGACSSSLLLSPSHTFCLLKHGSSPQAAIPVKKICCGVGSTQAVVPWRIACAPAWGNPVTICTGAGLPRAAGNLCSGTEAPPCPSPLSLTLVFPLVAHSLFILPFPLWCFLYFLTCIISGVPKPHGWWTLLWPLMGLARTGCEWSRAAPSLLLQKPSLQPSCHLHQIHVCIFESL